MTTVPLSDYQRKLCEGNDGYFFLACIEHFGFLVTDRGYKMSFAVLDRGLVQASFKEDILTEYFEIRLSCDEWDLPWCDIRRFAGLDHQTYLRIGDACALLSIGFDESPIPDSMLHELATQSRIKAYANTIRTHFDEFRNIPLGVPQ